VIVSSHNFKLTPSTEDLCNLVARIQATGADIVKIATTALDIADVTRMFQIMTHSQVSHVLIINYIYQFNDFIEVSSYTLVTLICELQR